MARLTRIVCGMAMTAGLLVTMTACTGLTPEMRGLSESWDEAHNNAAYLINHNRRMINSDIDRVMYWDHPSRLTAYPVMDQSGIPR